MAADRKTYVKTQWVNDETPLDEENLNHLEEGVEKNNALAKENAAYLDEIYAAFIEQTTLAFNSETNELTLSFGSTSGANPTTRFHASFAVGLPVNIDTVNFAHEIYTERHIEDLDISCPPITYGIAGGEAEIATGIQQLTILYGNGTTGVKSAKVISRGKNQFAGFNEFIRVLSSEEYRIFTNLPSGLLLTEYDKDKEQAGYNENEISTDCIIGPIGRPDPDLEFEEETCYIKLAPANPTEVTDDTKVMVYLTFGESYSEEYEEPHVDEIVLPNITLRSVDEVRDEIYAEGGGIRRISEQGEILQSPTIISDVENPGWNPDLFVDNYGTILFLDTNNEEIEIEQPYQIIYKISLAEFLDSAYVKAKGNASDIALVSEIENGDVIAGLSNELTPFSESSGIRDLTPFIFQTSGGNSDIGSKAYLEKITGNTVILSETEGFDPETNEDKFIFTKPIAYKIVGYNACKENLKQGYWIESDEEVFDGDIRSAITADFIRVIPGLIYTPECYFDDNNSLNGGEFYIVFYDKNKQYLTDMITTGNFSIPNGCHYVKIGISCNNEIDLSKTHLCFHLTWDESKKGYEKYYEITYPLPGIVLRKCGNVADELRPDGTLIRRVGVLDLGDIPWTIDGDYKVFSESGYENIKPQTSLLKPSSAECERKYTSTNSVNFGNGYNSYELLIDSSGRIHIYDDDYYMNYSDDFEQFKQSLKGNLLIYELKTPVVEQNDDYKFTKLTKIDDFGTQEIIQDQEINIPQGVQFFYPSDYKAFLDSLGQKSDYDPEKFNTRNSPLNLDLVNNENMIKDFVAILNDTIKFYGKVDVYSSPKKSKRLFSGTYLTPGQMYGTKTGKKYIYTVNDDNPYITDNIMKPYNSGLIGGDGNKYLVTISMDLVDFIKEALQYMVGGIDFDAYDESEISRADKENLFPENKSLRNHICLRAALHYDNLSQDRANFQNAIKNLFTQNYLQTNEGKLLQGQPLFSKTMLKFGILGPSSHCPISNQWIEIITRLEYNEDEEWYDLYFLINRKNFRSLK